MVHDEALKRIEMPSRQRFSVSMGVLFQFSACVLLLTGRGADWSIFAMLLGGCLDCLWRKGEGLRGLALALGLAGLCAIAAGHRIFCLDTLVTSTHPGLRRGRVDFRDLSVFLVSSSVA